MRPSINIIKNLINEGLETDRYFKEREDEENRKILKKYLDNLHTVLDDLTDYDRIVKEGQA